MLEQAGPSRTIHSKTTSSRRRMSRHLDEVRFHQLTKEELEEEERDTRVRRKDNNVTYVDAGEVSSRGADGMKSSIQEQMDTEACPFAPNCNLVRTGACIYKFHPGQEITEHSYYTVQDPTASVTEKFVKVAKEVRRKFANVKKRSKLRLLVGQIMAKK